MLEVCVIGAVLCFTLFAVGGVAQNLYTARMTDAIKRWKFENGEHEAPANLFFGRYLLDEEYTRLFPDSEDARNRAWAIGASCAGFAGMIVFVVLYQHFAA
jgi:hypothetical protein